jgi:cytochrome-b5 reductase
MGAILLEVSGTDATEAFEEIGYSDEAREQLEPSKWGTYRQRYAILELILHVILATSGTCLVYRSLPANLRTNIPIRRCQRQEVHLLVIADTGNHKMWHNKPRRQSRHNSLPSRHDHHPNSSRSTFTPVLHLNRQGLGHFWTGVGIASVVQCTLTLGLRMWISTKLDVQQEFAHHVPRRPAKTARITRLPRSNLPTKKPNVLDPRKSDLLS